MKYEEVLDKRNTVITDFHGQILKGKESGHCCYCCYSFGLNIEICLFKAKKHTWLIHPGLRLKRNCNDLEPCNDFLVRKATFYHKWKKKCS